MTPATAASRPAAEEYAPYYERYISLVPDGDPLNVLVGQTRTTLELLRGIPESRADFAYAPGKWSIREVLGHVTDAERVFSYRALRFARNDATPLASFDENEYVRNANFARRTLSSLTKDFEHVRQATMDLFTGFDAGYLQRSGTASGARMSVRALLYVIAGHERHHMEMIRTRYLAGR